VSQRLKKQLIGEFGVAEEKITVVPICSQLATPNSQRTMRQDKIFVFLTVGRLVPVKNIGMQIEAMAEVVKKYPEAELLIVGEGREGKNYELKITNYELENNVKLLGRKDDLADYYKAADAFVLTSDSEGWGLAVVEAAAAGLPIIMTEVGCAGEVIKNGESGLVIPVGDKPALVLAMARIISDENLRKRLAENAKLAAGRLPSKEQTLILYLESWQKAEFNK